MSDEITPTQIESERSHQCRCDLLQILDVLFFFFSLSLLVHTNQLFDVTHWNTRQKWIMMQARGMTKSYLSIYIESIGDDNSR